MKIKRQPTPLEKKANRGFRGYPIATIAFYGPDDSRATKIAVGVVLEDDGKVVAMKRWISETGDLRLDPGTGKEVLAFIREQGALTVVVSPGIIGCPHEEEIDYPEGEVCPVCPFWADRDRWTGEKLPQN